MTEHKRVPATCPNCGATELNLSLIHEGKVVSLAGVQLKLQLTEIPQLWCIAPLPESFDGWIGACDFEQSGTIDEDGYAVFGKLVKSSEDL